MVNENKKIADTVVTEMGEMRVLMEKMFGELTARLEKFDDTVSTEMGGMCALMERLFGELIARLEKLYERMFEELNVRLEKFYERMFGELNARLDKFDEQILELKKCIESSRDQDKGKKMTESAMNSSSNGHENSSMLQEEQVKMHRELITAAYSCKRNKKKNIISLIEDDGGNAPIVDLVPTEETTIDVIEDNDAHISIVDLVPTEENKRDMIKKDNNNITVVDLVPTEKTKINMELSVDNEFCVTGYHGELPLDVLIGLMGKEETTHNFINESLADKLGCETVPIQPQTVHSDLGEMVTSRLCNNFQLSMEGTVFNLKVYLLPLSLKYDIILGAEWLGALEKFIISIAGIELYLLEGEKKFMPFKKAIRGRRRKRF